MKSLTTRERLFVRWAVVASSFVAAIRFGAPAWNSAWSDTLEGLRVERRALQAERALVTSRAAIDDSLRARRQRLASVMAGLIAEKDPALAAARLANTVSGAASNAGLVVSALDHRPDTATGSALRHPQVRGEARGDISGLMQFLLLIELGPPMMRVRTLSIVAADARGASTQPEELRVSFVIEGVSFARGDELLGGRR